MTNPTKTVLKIKIPAQTVEVNLENWALSYGIEPNAKSVREDVKAYFFSYGQEVIDSLDLNDV
jgi:hypothetical protein